MNEVAQQLRADVDLDEEPLFDIDSTHEPDRRGAMASPGLAVSVEGVLIPHDAVTHGNGRLPTELLVPIGIGGHRLHPRAAAAFQVWREQAAAAGIDLTCSDTYRTIAQQEQLKALKPKWSATPGRSVHGWGFAVDVAIGSPPKAFGITVLNWLKESGPALGWFLGRPKDEPWHWVYRGVAGAQKDSLAKPPSTIIKPTSEKVPKPRPPILPPTPPVGTETTLDPAAEKVFAEIAGSAEVKRDSQGPAVSALRALLGLGDGTLFDEATEVAVKAFQEHNALKVDGRVGKVTWAKIRSTTAPADRPLLKRTSTGDAVAWLQRRLNLSDDGSFGKQTEAAIKGFQRAKKLEDDGRVGPATWTALIS